MGRAEKLAEGAEYQLGTLGSWVQSMPAVVRARMPGGGAATMALLHPGAVESAAEVMAASWRSGETSSRATIPRGGWSGATALSARGPAKAGRLRRTAISEGVSAAGSLRPMGPRGRSRRRSADDAAPGARRLALR